MIGKQSQFAAEKHLHLVITDSGLGGLSICAEIERNFRQAGPHHAISLTYFNAWPYPGMGYNSLPDMRGRARVFDRALASMDRFKPDRIVIACNTLSILYPLTEHSRTTAIPVLGIVDAGVNLFVEALVADPQSSIILLGTRTTIESNVHRDRMLQKGISVDRIIPISCHGLAAAIEQNPDSPAVADLVDRCALEACKAVPAGRHLWVGLCCTHYSYIEDTIRKALEQRLASRIQILDPNHRMASCVAPREDRGQTNPARKTIRVQVISKVEISERQRDTMARRIESVSDNTARALLSYTNQPDLF